jgi:hypothetical protein
MKDWKIYYTTIPKKDFITGKAVLPEDAKTYEVWDDDYKDIFRASYSEEFRDFGEESGIIMNISTWHTVINDEIVYLPNVTRYREI